MCAGLERFIIKQQIIRLCNKTYIYYLIFRPLRQHRYRQRDKGRHLCPQHHHQLVLWVLLVVRVPDIAAAN